VIKLKETEGSSTVQITINDQTHKKKGSTKYIFDIKGYQFIFLKAENETIYKFYIDSICLDDLMPNNKKQKKSFFDNPIPETDWKTMLIKPTKNINNINAKDKPKNRNDFSPNGEKKEIKEEVKEEVKKEEKKEVQENEDDIPEYDYLCQKIITADPF
jgi:hypothetical protein